MGSSVASQPFLLLRPCCIWPPQPCCHQPSLLLGIQESSNGRHSPEDFISFPLPETFFPFMCNQKKKMIRGLAVIKITRGSKANELCAEIPFFQGFSLDSNIAHEYKPGSTHPKPQGSTSGQTPGRLLEFGTTLPV